MISTYYAIQDGCEYLQNSLSKAFWAPINGVKWFFNIQDPEKKEVQKLAEKLISECNERFKDLRFIASYDEKVVAELKGFSDRTVSLIKMVTQAHFGIEEGNIETLGEDLKDLRAQISEYQACQEYYKKEEWVLQKLSPISQYIPNIIKKPTLFLTGTLSSECGRYTYKLTKSCLNAVKNRIYNVVIYPLQCLKTPARLTLDASAVYFAYQAYKNPTNPLSYAGALGSIYVRNRI
ncbi:MAG: hypothetical protein COT85_07165 [Chlamydiae bacterium CG10_big_fil_rev_8_21_14_0_10_42_34]|nr:MAG: hypothetical protein COT85_07165 [Chlamydiae bacterium CG10_big_fil_rev_8_21_14_0_10_42_34]